MPVALGEDGGDRRPGHGQVRVVPAHGVGVRAVVVLGHQVDVVRRLAEHAVAVAQPAGQEEAEAFAFAGGAVPVLPALLVLRAVPEHEGGHLAEGGALRADVGDGDEDPPLGDVDQLLPVLGVEPAQDARRERAWFCCTKRTGPPAGRFELVEAEGLAEEPPLVRAGRPLDHEQSVDGGRPDHAPRAPSPVPPTVRSNRPRAGWRAARPPGAEESTVRRDGRRDRPPDAPFPSCSGTRALLQYRGPSARCRPRARPLTRRPGRPLRPATGPPVGRRHPLCARTSADSSRYAPRGGPGGWEAGARRGYLGLAPAAPCGGCGVRPAARQRPLRRRRARGAEEEREPRCPPSDCVRLAVRSPERRHRRRPGWGAVRPPRAPSRGDGGGSAAGHRHPGRPAASAVSRPERGHRRLRRCAPPAWPRRPPSAPTAAGRPPAPAARPRAPRGRPVHIQQGESK